MAEDLDMDGALYRELWHACAGPLTSVPREGEHVFYFPQGHLEQLEELTYQGLEQRVRYFDLQSKILCRVIKVRLLAEPETDEVYAQITLLPEPVVSFLSLALSENASQDPPFPEPRCAVLSLCKTLAASDLGINGVFSISGMDADGCLPPLDMSQQPPCQELVAMDLHGKEWKFQHNFQGFDHGFQVFEVFILQLNKDVTYSLLDGASTGENGKLHVGVRRCAGQQISRQSSIISSQSMCLGLLATASDAIVCGTMFTVFYKPRTIRSDFIVNVEKYHEAIRYDFFVGMRFKMRFEGEEVPVQRFSGMIVGFEDYGSSMWSGSKWRSLKVWLIIAVSFVPNHVRFNGMKLGHSFVQKEYHHGKWSLQLHLDCELHVKYKKRTLAVVFLMLEAISVILDLFGTSKQSFLLATFLLSAFGFVITIYACIKGRTISASRLRAERQLGLVEVVFSVVQLATTFIDYLIAVLDVKNKYNASLLPLAFAIIVVVFVFKKDDKVLVSRRKHLISSLGNLQGFSLINSVPDEV
ncbi:hypothetical protein EZV62_018883 [Acer yangbiense]|uniref:Auxin response factor domain-containing protein n=1 Tax=Acer yangbiense TaxID=1000413 RepID=A0A5C7H9M7_9ROSI|nr:hypothetical protein EZV62_018883 [Acer yangbiense]